ncbi:MAG: 50S ribosomal protein L20 [Eubacteriales bacterium]|jgi:large subunit ribosomal protein L20|nr:50S ribosomal protein L20 [Eubacteriales bacterium]MCI6573470.1 50S ribosomal protein L20 [Bacillota bacterium]MDY5586149.1 50S ribosomal protein L20 [Eubacteriales bacterium]
MRIKRSVNALKKRRAILKQAKGYRGAKSKLYRIANEAVMKSGNYAYIGRRLKKRDFRRLWIARINAACRLNDISYSRFINGLKVANISLNRKVLSELATNNPSEFSVLVSTAKTALAK